MAIIVVVRLCIIYLLVCFVFFISNWMLTTLILKTNEVVTVSGEKYKPTSSQNLQFLVLERD